MTPTATQNNSNQSDRERSEYERSEVTATALAVLAEIEQFLAGKGHAYNAALLNEAHAHLTRLLAAADALAEAACKLRESSGFARTDALREFRDKYTAYREASRDR